VSVRHFFPLSFLLFFAGFRCLLSVTPEGKGERRKHPRLFFGTPEWVKPVPFFFLTPTETHNKQTNQKKKKKKEKRKWVA
jgi:hypothetical protein